ncbi:sensor histidine kinase [Clostridium sp. AWRP]|uniref:sensor histidine kinase n=1 Tax=Clostridium sp. AWRP TaxID=2212991 RepID=UPI000FDC5D90|nr:sensor histidine kinase [Clostridium sp. AWRP]AZV56423.1 HAMP domain-containing histidine kinase [Clostridium sp. AWRP]
MNLKVYLKKSIWAIIHFIIIITIVNLVLIGTTGFSKIMYDVIYMNILVFCVSIFFLIFRYKKWKERYKDFYEGLMQGKSVDLLITKDDVFEAKLIKDTIKLKNKELYENVNELKKELDELNEYITKWVHEIKIPISVCELISDKLEDTIDTNSDIPESLRGELARIKFLVEQVLYAGRASSYSQDLLINEVNIKQVVNEAVKKNAFFFISKRIDLRLKELQFNVLTDKKWLSYILEQVLNNACKYVGENGIVEIYCEEDEKSISLCVRDNGIGILPKDISRVFDKGFTGSNGRKSGKSTGMGLYFSKKMAEKLNHDIKVVSQAGNYTEFIITFYKLSDYFKV